MDQLVVVIALVVGTVVIVGIADRIRLPYPALMVVLGIVLAALPGLPPIEINPDLILPLFLPPLLYATAQRTSWAVFRTRWRAILLLAVALVLLTILAAAYTAWLLIPGIGIGGALVLGAIVAPPDPVAVEAVAGSLRIPRRIMSILQGEGLFNDAAAVVVFEMATLAVVRHSGFTSGTFVLRMVYAAIAAVVIGLVVAWVADKLGQFTTSAVAHSALSVVVPFAVYLLADRIEASGVIAVVVAALQMQAHSDADEAEERLTGRAFWDVIELIVTGVAFGLIGLEVRPILSSAGSALPGMIVDGLVVSAVVIVLRGIWLYFCATVSGWSGVRFGGRDTLVALWCGMRGLATLALALGIPVLRDSGEGFPARDEILVIAIVVLFTTLVIPALTLPALVKALGIAEEADSELNAERALMRRAQRAAFAAIKAKAVNGEYPEEVTAIALDRIGDVEQIFTGHSLPEEQVEKIVSKRNRVRQASVLIDDGLAAARAEVLAARSEPGIDPEVADGLLYELDLRTVMRN